MKKLIRVGSRESKLAIIQSEIVMGLIKKNYPDYDIELITMKTTGDKILDKTLDKIGGKGLFVKELDKALIENKVDITVHSLKDVPMEVDERIPLIAFTKRECPFDVLVLPKGKTEIDFSKPIGSSSMRRNLQFKKLYPNAVIKPIRGNVLTRLEKLDNGEFSAIILAQAGLKRLGLENRISRIFTSQEMIPAGGQGIIAIQGRAGENYDFIDCINDEDAQISAIAERSFVKRLDGGCSSPIAAFCEKFEDNIKLTGLYADENKIEIKSIQGKSCDAQKLGEELADKIKEVIL